MDAWVYVPIVILLASSYLVTSFCLHPRSPSVRKAKSSKMMLSVKEFEQVNRRQEFRNLLKDPFFDADRIQQASRLDISLPPLRDVSTRKRVRVYCISDLHADTSKNQLWVQEHCQRLPSDPRDSVFTVIVVPGDIGSDINSIQKVFKMLTPVYDMVCYIPGNHELWRRGMPPNTTDPGAEDRPTVAADSLVKMQAVLDCAAECGVHCGPVRIKCPLDSTSPPHTLLLQPLQAWYHSSWDQEPDLDDPLFTAVEKAVPFRRRWGDYSLCSWPPELLDQTAFVTNARNNTVLAEAFAALNEPHLKAPPRRTPEVDSDAFNLDDVLGSPHCASDSSNTVITYSHYLPRQELCPEKRSLLEPKLSEVVGSLPLETQIRRLQSTLHLFGHTHVPIDLHLDGVRYVQWPLGYQRERTSSCAPVHLLGGPLCVWDSQCLIDSQDSRGIPEDMASLHCAWSVHYRNHPRTPEVLSPLQPWVRNRLESFAHLVHEPIPDPTPTPTPLPETETETGQTK